MERREEGLEEESRSEEEEETKRQISGNSSAITPPTITPPSTTPPTTTPPTITPPSTTPLTTTPPTITPPTEAGERTEDEERAAQAPGNSTTVVSHTEAEDRAEDEEEKYEVSGTSNTTEPPTEGEKAGDQEGTDEVSLASSTSTPTSTTAGEAPGVEEEANDMSGNSISQAASDIPGEKEETDFISGNNTTFTAAECRPGDEELLTADNSGNTTLSTAAECRPGHKDDAENIPENNTVSTAADCRPGDEEGTDEASGNSSTPVVAEAPPSSLALSGSRPRRRKVLVAPALSLSLGDSTDDFPIAFLSPSPDDEDDVGLDIDLDALETPSDSESLHFPAHDLDVEDDLRRLGVASWHDRVYGSSPGSRSGSRSGSLPGADPTGLGSLDQDMVDGQGTRWRCFNTGHPPQENRVNMSVLEPYLRVLSHGGYYGDSMNDIIMFSSCYLPENSLENYQYVMDNLFRYVVGTLELMVAENYVIVYLCAMAQKDKLPGIGWLRDCYTTINRRLRKNLKGLYVVHPTWYIKALITIIKPFISSKFSRKLQFVDSLQGLSQYIPTEHVQIPDCVRQFDEGLDR